MHLQCSVSPLKKYKPGSCRSFCAISLLSSLSAHFLFAFNRPGNVMYPLDYNGDLNVAEVPKARLHKCLHVFLTRSTESIDYSLCLRYGKFAPVSTISCNSCKSQLFLYLPLRYVHKAFTTDSVGLILLCLLIRQLASMCTCARNS